MTKLYKWLWVCLATLLVGYLVLTPQKVRAATVAIAEFDGRKVLLDDGDCELPGIVNLPHKGVWEENGKSFKICWDATGTIVVVYRDDRRIAVVSGQFFRLATGV